MRKIRYKAKRILLEWVKHLVKKENQHNITPEKFKVLLNTVSYKWNGTTKVLQPMSYRWLVQTLKKNPEATLEKYGKTSQKLSVGTSLKTFDGTDFIVEKIERYEGDHWTYTISTDNGNFYAGNVLVDSEI